jgi:hypothetical protein
VVQSAFLLEANVNIIIPTSKPQANAMPADSTTLMIDLGALHQLEIKLPHAQLKP